MPGKLNIYGNGETSERIKIPLYCSSVLPRCGSYNR